MHYKVSAVMKPIYAEWFMWCGDLAEPNKLDRVKT